MRVDYKTESEKKGEKVWRGVRGVRGVEICSGVLNIKPISSLMKCKYYGESLNWNTERKGVKGGIRFIISSVHL